MHDAQPDRQPRPDPDPRPRPRWSRRRVLAAVGVAAVIALQSPCLSWTLQWGLRMDSGKAMMQTSWNVAMVLLDLAAITLLVVLPPARDRLLIWLPWMLLLASLLALPMGQALRPVLRLITGD